MTKRRHEIASSITSYGHKPVLFNASRRQIFRWAAALILSALLLPITSLRAQERQALKLIELYTSHGCSSCPAADRLLGELLDEDSSLLALEYHVDYWNSLVHGNDGSFTDPFSSASHSERQREYNTAKLSGRPGVYTPQAIINGRVATVGSNRKHITRALSRSVEQVFDVRITPLADNSTLSVVVAGSEQQMALKGTDIVLVQYLDKVNTQITGGENNGKTLTNQHIVSASTLLGEVPEQGAVSFTIDKPVDGEGCVVLIQEQARSPVYAAATCP